jgi:hypothetical protein
VGSDVCACIPTIPPRKVFLGRALGSVFDQTVLPDAVAVAVDTDHDGVWVTRARTVAMADTRWVAFLDDDDEWLPHHLERLLACQADTGADLVYSCFETVPPGRDVLGLCGRPFDIEHPPTTVTITVLVDRQLASTVELGPPDPEWTVAQDDHFLLHGALALGAKVVHLPEVTWRYWHHGQHSSGLPSRW